MREHTKDCHKSLLPIDGRPVLGYILEEILGTGAAEIVIVTGHRNEEITAFSDSYSPTIRTVFNGRFEEDTNILSTELGVSALKHPENGYLILETDIFMEKQGWNDALLSMDQSASKWLTHNTYSPELTGGALRVDAQGQVDRIVYSPQFDPKFTGWPKLIGGLYVAPPQVRVDRSLRAAAISRSIAQYYMTPWVESLNKLACKQLDLSRHHAISFNDPESYAAAIRGQTSISRDVLNEQ